jgi:predicted secreted protein
MTSAAFWAYGSKLQLGDGGSPEAFSDIAEIIELNAPQMSRDEIDVTSHQSSDGYREFIAGLRDAGEVNCMANWLPTNATHSYTTGLHASFNTNTNKNWRIVLPSTLITIAFTGFVTAFEPDLPLEEQGQLSFTIKVSGKPTVS